MGLEILFPIQIFNRQYEQALCHSESCDPPLLNLQYNVIFFLRFNPLLRHLQPLLKTGVICLGAPAVAGMFNRPALAPES